ncbi:MAG: four helix bundle protein [Phycisphaera sp. RhM]|nr:four helix bundle protein [Phycisphaera sp. RhM]
MKTATGLKTLGMDWTMRPEFFGKGDLANQIRRATLWVSNNFVEGSVRGSATELLHYIDVARGSDGFP